MPSPVKKNVFLATVADAVYRHQMLERGDTVLVAVSGGPDSVALLHCLVAMETHWDLRLVVGHLNHQLRGAIADEEAAFVERLASGLEIPCEIGSRNVESYGVEHRLSVQQAARAVRYAFYDEVADDYGATKIALGHQADDNAESILMHLLRGTGPRGLAGIPPVREGRIIRPLIDVTRAQVLQFLKDGGFQYVRDRSNRDPKYLRNRIRHQLLPSLNKDYNPNTSSALTRLASILRHEEDFWNHHVQGALQDLLLKQTTDRITLSANGLARLHPALLRRLVRYVVLSLEGNLKRLGHSHVEAVVRLTQGTSPSGRLDLPHGIGVVRDRHEVTFLLGLQEARPVFEYHITGMGTTFIREVGTLLKLSVCGANEIKRPKEYPPTTALFDFAAVSLPLIVRSFKEGDRFRPLGMSGSQKVKDFFINNKVSRSRRQKCLLLLSGGRIIWVGGYRIDDSAKMTERTKRVLKAELLRA